MDVFDNLGNLHKEAKAMKLINQNKEVNSVPCDIMNLLSNHREVFIITADPDESESNIAVFTKLLDEKGVITPMLIDLLKNLLSSVKRNEQCSTF